jgi:2-C-methyl-D-erythritol 4-phosphate cytidylyltransferase
MSTWSIVVAAGSGTRYGRAKQYDQLAGRRVLDHALAAARSVSDGVVVVVAAEHESDPEPDVDVVVVGGSTRSASVRAGLAAVAADADIVLVHDGARPLADPALFERVATAVAEGADAVVPVVDLVDSVRHRAGGAVDRSTLVAVQTPQGFRADSLRQAHAAGGEATDDATLVEEIGGKVVLVQGDPDNVKLTRAADLALAEALLAEGAR